MTASSTRAAFRHGLFGAALAAALAFGGAPAGAQTYGLATMQPGTLAHTTGTAIAKVLKEKGGLNTLVQTTAGETVLIPMVARGEIDLGIANLAEVQAQAEGPNRQSDLRLIGVIHPLWASFFVRRDTTMQTNADMKGKRIALGYSAMRTVDMLVQAQLALGGRAVRRHIDDHHAGLLGAQEGFLDHILGIMIVSGVAPRHRGQPRAVAFHDGGKGLIVPLNKSIN